MAYVSRRKPRVKQAEALKRMKGRKVFALLMAMRTGKTKVILDDFGHLWVEGLADDLCVIAPLGALPPWVGAVDDEWPTTMRSKARVYLWEGRPTSNKGKKELADFLAYRDGPRLLLINIEALSGVEDAQLLIAKFAKQRKCVGVVDESTVIKNPTAKRTKFMCKKIAPLFVYRRILSGLITPRSPLDLYAQFYFLDKAILGHDSYFTFRNRYAVLKQMDFGGRKVDIVVGYRDEAQLRALIEPHSFRVRLEDCYDMPASVYEPVYVEMTPEQDRIYKELKQFATAKIEGEAYVSAQIVIAQLLRMHQVVLGHTKDEEGNTHLIPENRTQALVDLLDNYDGKAIIWCSYDIDIRKLSERLEKEFGPTKEEFKYARETGMEPPPPVVARFWGGNKKQREDEERIFKTKAGCRFILATPDAGGRGRTWDMADLVLYFSSKDNLEHRAQSEERPKGDGKKRPIIYRDFIVKNTVEVKIVKALRNKINMAAVINGDTWREWLI